ncbi:MAG TPA: alpha/beta fold hydrolase [Pirellulaceae bacterium]|nr:alpha/beta fold hydrolase [Pirellulaceae bacterium]
MIRAAFLGICLAVESPKSRVQSPKLSTDNEKRKAMRSIHLPSVVCFVVLSAAIVGGQEPRFTTRLINPAAEYPACAVFDVNQDGQMDIVSGGFWYAGPKWEKHFLRDVEVIRGRFDDYSNLPLDVNSDGWLDIVSVNYRSQSLFWLAHPGEKIKSAPDTPWQKHVIDTPGPMETGRLHDIDGDGQLDILPNGIGFACWYELVRDAAGSGENAPRFVKHDLPKEVAGHGIGFGDVNGDGRGDIVGPRGWLEAPEDRRGGRWTWHPEWELTRDASIPILVHDVDGDGDADLIWGRGHRYGLYWLEQTKDAAGKRSWRQHAIDTSWAQPHSLLLADLNGDKRVELIAGKRYMGHEGKDPGEWDVLCAYSYQFDPKLRTWRRSELHVGQRVGFGLDPKVADLDGDGDLDLVAADRSSLAVLINEGVGRASQPVPAREPDRELQPVGQEPGRTRKPYTFEDLGRAGKPVPQDMGIRREHIRRGMAEAMGDLPDPSRRVPLDVRIESREEKGDYVRIKLTYVPERGDRVPTLLLVPKSVALEEQGLNGTLRDGANKKLPAMLCLHPTNVDGKAQTAAMVGAATRHYGHQLAQRGYVCLIPDYPSFGEYKDYDFAQKRPGSDELLYVSGSMKAIWNNIRAVDLLESLGYVDADNIGVIGHSLGGHNALYTAVFDPRLKAVVTSCGFTTFHDYYAGNLKGWTSDRYMPRIRDVYELSPDRMPFDFPEVLAAIAPRGLFVNAPLHDANFDNGGVRKCIAAATPVYELLGAKEQLQVVYPDCAHDFPDEVREQVYGWLDKQLSQ